MVETNLTEKDYEILNAMVSLYPIDVECKNAIAKTIKVIVEQQEEIVYLKSRLIEADADELAFTNDIDELRKENEQLKLQLSEQKRVNLLKKYTIIVNGEIVYETGECESMWKALELFKEMNPITDQENNDITIRISKK